MSDDAYDDMLTEMYNEVDAAIEASGQKRNHVIYSAYDVIDDLPVNNLHEIPYRGTFTVVAEHDDFWDGMGSGWVGDTESMSEPRGRNYESVVVTDPTWLALSVLANQAIIATNDLHHVYLECVVKKGNKLELSFGS